MIYLYLFFGFLKIGCFSFGGAYSAIPLIRDVVLSYGWITDETLSYMIAVSESTPGPIMVNLATYVGSSQAGLIGAILATFAVTLPSFIIILLIVIVLNDLLDNLYVKAILRGLTPCSIGIIFATGIYMVISNCVYGNNITVMNKQALTITIILVLVVYGSKIVLKKKISPILLIVISACLGIIIYGV